MSQSGEVFIQRIEVHTLQPAKLSIPQPDWLQVAAFAHLFHVESTRRLDETDVEAIAANLFDPVLQRAVISSPVNTESEDSRSVVMDVMWREGVTDNRGSTALASLALGLGKERFQQLGVTRVNTGETYHLQVVPNAKTGSQDEQKAILHWAAEGILNPLVQFQKIQAMDSYRSPLNWSFSKAATHAIQNDSSDNASSLFAETYPISAAMADWQRWNETNSWALSRSEIEQIREYFSRPDVTTRRYESGLPENPTDVEIEIIAQTWSEHCKHKIFAANVEYSDVEYSESQSVSASSGNFKKLGVQKIRGLFKSKIVAATKKIEAERNIDWLSSTFSDNAGMVRFDERIDVSIKVETHNSPSALDPYGGALTGILGVNRDILGTGMGARPVANTDVLCFGMPDWSGSEVEKFLPHGLKHPRRIMEGVHKGIEDGGNKSGIPVVNGAMVFDDGYCGKPLVYCGTIGVSPAILNDGRPGWKKHIAVGDLVVMAGGRVGKDGIHGATFSSLELNESSPQSAVQIGDPLTQKRLADFVLAARDAGLFSGLTDNGAGGLSSSVGEMAQFTGGARIDVGLVPLKYPGLMPWEVVVSESQERMTLAVPPQNWTRLNSLATEYGVEVTMIGEFNQSGQFRIEWNGNKVAAIDLAFLFDELKPMELAAEWLGPQPRNDWVTRKEKTLVPRLQDGNPGFVPDLARIARHVLSRPNVASKEKWVRRFDHEVQAATAGKPFCGVDGIGPADGGVIWLAPHGAKDPFAGVAIASGINAKIAHVDTYLSAVLSIDEAVRNLVSSGGDPDMTCLVDNFCWPDPLPGKNNPDHAHKMAQLVRSCAALYDVATAWGMPFVSGKDSMKNDFTGLGPDGCRVKISVPPTVLITAMARVPDVRRVVGSDFKGPDELIFVVGPDQDWPIHGSEFEGEFSFDHMSSDLTAPIDFPELDFMRIADIYRRIHDLLNAGLLRSIHDVSDGGLFASIAESAIGGRRGVRLTAIPRISREDAFETDRWLASLFHEGPGRFVVSIKENHREEFLSRFSGLEMCVTEIGHTTIDESSGVQTAGGSAEIWLDPLAQGVALADLTSWWRNAL